MKRKERGKHRKNEEKDVTRKEMNARNRPYLLSFFAVFTPAIFVETVASQKLLFTMALASKTYR
jgi:hypothetical protein